MGLKVVAPESANFTLTWLMPTLTDYGVWPPRPVDLSLSLKRPGDEAEITLDDLKVRAIFVPGHTFDSVIYAMELGGKRVVFTGDIGFDNQDNSAPLLGRRREGPEGDGNRPGQSNPLQAGFRIPRARGEARRGGIPGGSGEEEPAGHPQCTREISRAWDAVELRGFVGWTRLGASLFMALPWKPQLHLSHHFPARGSSLFSCTPGPRS